MRDEWLCKKEWKFKKEIGYKKKYSQEEWDERKSNCIKNMLHIKGKKNKKEGGSKKEEARNQGVWWKKGKYQAFEKEWMENKHDRG